MIMECCSQERSFLKFYGLLAEVILSIIDLVSRS